MEPRKELESSSVRHRSSAAAKLRAGASGCEQQHVPATTSPGSPSTPESPQAPSVMPQFPELQHRPPNPAWNFYPAGGFVNLINQPYMPMRSQPLGENFHFVGHTQNFTTYPPPPPSAKRTPKPSRLAKEPINIDGDGDAATEEPKTVKKRYWTHDEEVRLASAWLNCSNDPIHGNDKKGDHFWKEISEYFNKNSPPDRQRDVNQLKVHWSRLKTAISNFNGCWSAVSKMHTSGYSDDQLMDEAQKMYANANSGKPFTLVHWWKALRNEPKFRAHISQVDKEKGQSCTIGITEDGDQLPPRPIGRDASKAQKNGKRKVDEVLDGIVLLGENINKIVEVQHGRKEEREKVAAAQLEISRLQLKAAQEQKEAKMLEVYSSLLQQDTSQLSEQARINREKTLQKMELKLFGETEII